MPINQEFNGRFQVIMADPPWSYDNWSTKATGAVKAQYSTMSLEQIKALPIEEISAPNSALLLWCTQTASAEGFHTEVMKAWGFRPVTKAFYWRKVYDSCVCSHPSARHAENKCSVRGCTCQTLVPKPYCGLGFYTRSGSEDCWLGLRGRMPVKNRNIYQEIEAAVGTHSTKPAEIYARVEAMWPEAEHRLELFARRPRVGWSAWGDQIQSPARLFDADEPVTPQGALTSP